MREVGSGGGFRGAAAGLPHDQLGRQDEAAGSVRAPALEAVKKHLGGAASQFGGRLVDEGKSGAEDGGEFEVVEADHGNVFGNA